jgi:hypothetical protein
MLKDKSLLPVVLDFTDSELALIDEAAAEESQSRERFIQFTTRNAADLYRDAARKIVLVPANAVLGFPFFCTIEPRAVV